ncbi:hypothetical protein KP509_20G049700 [Ceratopteris richardii]|uniref:Response regulatory domain-containing protein n=1 Tax=Ceratopteris richardii TaxID=49495 RepID=A0A8T2SFW3_CERRI|nr:hypothetical protein KP509_20G049700 [Ceratopteris richardii]
MAKDGYQFVSSQREKTVCEHYAKASLSKNRCTVFQYDASTERETKKDKDLKDLKAAVVEAEEEESSDQIHILAVDDNFVDRKVVERLVRTACFTVTSVDSGHKALEVLSRNENINLIITDYCMPEMSGYDLLKRLKEAAAFKDIPVVIMSSENVPNRIQRCLDEGAKDFFLKPVQLADVKRLRSYVLPLTERTLDQSNVPCKRRKFNSDEFQVHSPDRGPQLGSVTVA